MTNISALSSSSYASTYRSPLDTNGDGVVSADELLAGQTSGQTGGKSSSTTSKSTDAESDDALVVSALDKLASLIQSFMLQLASGSSSDPGEKQQDGLFTKLDADGDGAVSKTEFASGKPQQVSDEQSAALFASGDSDGDGLLSAEEFAALQADAPHRGPPPPPSPSEIADSSSDTDGTLADLLKTLRSAIDAYIDTASADEEDKATIATV